MTAVAVPAVVVRYAPPVMAKPRPLRGAALAVVPQTVVPPVEPMAFVDLAPEDARAFNERVSFSNAPNPAARPFRMPGGAEDVARATDCLATAVLYEAGDDPAGQRAVAQVVINRARHPAFPKTICGVVFEGQERRTGCQFSFTCDGALTRWSPSEPMWRRAREVAARALAGVVQRSVGHATHYHTDWVVPYWQSSLDKITRVGSHLFFRWTGWWGTPPAFARQVSGSEPVVQAIAALSPAHRMGDALADADAALAEAALLQEALTGEGGDVAVMAIGAATRPSASDPNSFLVALPPGVAADSWPPLALQACGDRPVCRFSAWGDPARTPAALPLTPEQVSAMTFSYLRDRTVGLERTLWNCRQVKRASPRDCMRQQVFLTGVPPTVALPAPAQPNPVERASDPERAAAVRAAPLAGVRRVGDSAPAPLARPTPRPSPSARRGASSLRRPETSPPAMP